MASAPYSGATCPRTRRMPSGQSSVSAGAPSVGAGDGGGEVSRVAGGSNCAGRCCVRGRGVTPTGRSSAPGAAAAAAAAAAVSAAVSDACSKPEPSHLRMSAAQRGGAASSSSSSSSSSGGGGGGGGGGASRAAPLVERRVGGMQARR